MDDELQFKCAYPDKLSRGMKDMIQNLPPVVCGAEISVIDNDEACDRALAEISGETMLGFDTETRPSHKAGESYPVSILQLASEKKAWIFRLSRSACLPSSESGSSVFPRYLFSLLEAVAP